MPAMSDGPPTGDQQGTRQATDRPATVPVADAARRLGISPDAVRGRLQRGTLAGEKIAGVWHVAGAALPPDTAPTGQQPVDQQATTGQQQATDRPADSALVDQLRTENEYLRAELSARSRELAAERERADVLMREALGRIEALSAGETTNTAEDASQTRHDAPQEEHAADVATDTSAPWWRRWWHSVIGSS